MTRRTNGSTRRRGAFSMATWLAGLVALCAGMAAHAGEFVAGSEDLPLMPGLIAVEEAGMRFDSPAGRIVESVYEGIGDRDAIRVFYAETLPALGWQAFSEDRFLRDGEQLEIDFFGAGSTLTVRFTLAPE